MKNQFKDIVLETQNDCRKFGKQLLQGKIVAGIERAKCGDPFDVTVKGEQSASSKWSFSDFSVSHNTLISLLMSYCNCVES